MVVCFANPSNVEQLIRRTRGYPEQVRGISIRDVTRQDASAVAHIHRAGLAAGKQAID